MTFMQFILLTCFWVYIANNKAQKMKGSSGILIAYPVS